VEKIVDLVAPRSRTGLIIKATVLVGCFTAVDYIVSAMTASFTDQNTLRSLLITFLIGAPFGLFVMCVMIVQRKLKERLQYLSETDSLTGLPNRSAFFARAIKALEERSQGSVLMIDVDNFKAINDTYGHYAGDLALTQIGRHLRAILRPQDIVGRIGGEEFAVLLNADDPTFIDQIAKRICATLLIEARRSGDNTIQSFNVTFSIGGVVAQPGQNLLDRMRFADQALYHAKANGRNRVVFHDFENGGDVGRLLA